MILSPAMAGPAMAQSIHGTATYRERIALPPSAAFEAMLGDVSRAVATGWRLAQLEALEGHDR